MNIIKKYKKHILILLTIIVIVSLIILKIKLNNKEDIIIEEENITLEEKEEIQSAEILKEQEEIKKVSVDVKGAVINPGVYEIEENKRVIDVINLAGGLREDANTLLINLAKTVTNEMVVIIYTETQIKQASTKETNSIITPIDRVCNCPEITNDACINTKEESNQNNNKETTSSITDKVTSKVNINTATLEELQTLSGIGESKAKAIIEYRETNGNFTSIEDIKNVSGIGNSVYEKIKDHITV